MEILREEKAQLPIEQLLLVAFVVVGATIVAIFYKNAASTVTNTAKSQTNTTP